MKNTKDIRPLEVFAFLFGLAKSSINHFPNRSSNSMNQMRFSTPMWLREFRNHTQSSSLAGNGFIISSDVIQCCELVILNILGIVNRFEATNDGKQKGHLKSKEGAAPVQSRYDHF
jgi:hypothetical protein